MVKPIGIYLATPSSRSKTMNMLIKIPLQPTIIRFACIVIAMPMLSAGAQPATDTEDAADEAMMFAPATTAPATDSVDGTAADADPEPIDSVDGTANMRPTTTNSVDGTAAGRAMQVESVDGTARVGDCQNTGSVDGTALAVGGAVTDSVDGTATATGCVGENVIVVPASDSSSQD